MKIFGSKMEAVETVVSIAESALEEAKNSESEALAEASAAKTAWLVKQAAVHLASSKLHELMQTAQQQGKKRA